MQNNCKHDGSVGTVVLAGKYRLTRYFPICLSYSTRTPGVPSNEIH